MIPNLKFAIGWLILSLACAGGIPAHGFLHPGIGLNRTQLDQLKKFVSEGVEPWKSNYEYLTTHDHRFSKSPRIFTRRDENPTAIDNPDFDNRCLSDSQSAFCQAVLYEIDGDPVHREYALEVVRWFYTHITSGRPHWDSQFRWPNAERWYLMAAELLRYTGPKTGPLAWTDADTVGVNRFIAIGENFWWGRRTYLNQLHFALGGPLARAIWRDDAALYAEMVEILTVNQQGPVGQQNGSIQQMCRLVVSNEVTGAAVKPHVQFTEMGRDIGHPFPGSGALSDNLVILQSQGTRVDPVTGEVSTKKNAVAPIEFLGHRFLRGVNQICKYNLGFDIDWTPIYINREKGEVWERPCNAGGGRGRIVDLMDVLYSHYRWRRGLTFGKSEEARYFGYANHLRGPNPFYAFLWMPPEAAGTWQDERIDPGADGVNRFAEFIQPRLEGLSVQTGAEGTRYVSATIPQFIFPLFLHTRFPLPEAEAYTLRYRCDGVSALAIINPEDYATEFLDGESATKRRYVQKVKLPSTDGAWREFSFKPENPPQRNLVKIEFRTRASRLDLDFLRVQ